MTHRQLVTVSIIIVSSLLCLMVGAAAAVNIYMSTQGQYDSGNLKASEAYLTVEEAAEESVEMQEEVVKDVFNAAENQVEGFDDSILKQAQNLLDAMSIEEKIGQMIIADCPQEGAQETAVACRLGGYVIGEQYFADKTKEQVAEEIESLQSAQLIPMFTAVAEEGGAVNAVSTNSLLRGFPFWSVQELYEEGGLDWIFSDTQEKSILLKSLGINMNLAPVCNVAKDSSDEIYERSFGKSAEETAEYVKTVVRTMNDYSLGSVLKYFPAYSGNVSINEEDNKPFKAGIEEGATAVLVSSDVYMEDDMQTAAVFSHELHEALRHSMNFQGIIMADMNTSENMPDSAVNAVLAGNDMLYTNSCETAVLEISQAVQDGRVSIERINQSVLRILASKIKLGIIS